MAKGCLSQLSDAKRRKHFIRLSRRFEDPRVRGYVLDIGPKFFLLSLVSDRLWFDGFECFRVRDVLTAEPDPYATFAESALRRRGQRKPKKPRVSVRNIEAILLSAGRAFPLVTIHREQIDPDVCWIGRVLEVSRGRVSLLEINPDGTWDSRPTEYLVSEITQVNFGGDYEDALYLVGGDPPASQL
jgi:hypothetical protein